MLRSLFRISMTAFLPYTRFSSNLRSGSLTMICFTILTFGSFSAFGLEYLEPDCFLASVLFPVLITVSSFRLFLAWFAASIERHFIYFFCVLIGPDHKYPGLPPRICG